ncbi:phage tail tape measure protein [Pseudochrobactrum asaccharolyticum]|uniref:TP901 family phage tail tape measure protein n=1 Tax=Pseudochrobactrum asaccharolyticum TaxID=354351 RepID=A0A366DMI1_9HYPH|nr:phage tail tape measure protein [Pseudochrobactrum asaccharolyticum]RBO90524.1 TP901 family phage tail tape measure protein [Pseudochrobactrum asaccharolyticum]
MASRVATLRLQLIDSITGPAKSSSKALKGLETAISKLGSKGVPGAKNLGNQLDYLKRKSADVGEFRELRRGLAQAGVAFRDARSRARDLEQALNSATKPTAKMRADLRSAQTALKSTAQAFNEQRSAVRNAENALRAYSLNSRSDIAKSQAQVRSQIAQTITKMREMDRESRRARSQSSTSPTRSAPARISSGSVAAGAAGAYATSRGANVAKVAFSDAVNYDQAKAFRDAIGFDVFSDGDKKNLNAQAERIGYETRFTNADVVQGQLNLLQAGIRDTQQIINAMGPITDYALSMGVTLDEAATTIRSTALIKGVDLTDKAKIIQLVDSMVWMAKNGGMDDSDVRQFTRYAGAGLKSIGISDPVSSAMAAVLKRNGIQGDEAGVFARTASSKLGAPTLKGRMALQSMGIDYDDYVSWPDAFKVDGLGKMIRENFGKSLTPQMKEAITEFLDTATVFDSDAGEEISVKADRGAFVDGIIETIAPLFGDKLSAKDRQALSGKIGAFHKVSAESVDAEGLMMKILSSNASLAQLNSFFTDRQGNRAMMLARNYQGFLQMLELMKNTPEGITNKIGTKANEGLYGDYTRATGAIETARIKVIEDWEAPIRGILQATDWVASEFVKLSESTRRLIEVVGAAALAFGAYKAVTLGRGVLGRILGAGRTAAGGAAAGAVAKKGLMGRALGAAGRFATSPFGAVAGLVTLSGSTANNTYTNASAEDRQRMRDEARKRTDEYNAKRATQQAAQQHRDGIIVGLGQETVTWGVAAQEGMRAYVAALTQGGATAEAKASEIEAELVRIMSFEANPQVATASLERALGIARELSAVLRTELGAGGDGGSESGNTSIGGARAGGGPVQAGKTYAVGGRGVELFTPASNGNITPNSALGSSVTVQQTNHFHGGSQGADGEKLAVILDRQLRRSAQTAFGNISYGEA